jgi:hypothetical protein
MASLAARYRLSTFCTVENREEVPFYFGRWPAIDDPILSALTKGYLLVKRRGRGCCCSTDLRKVKGRCIICETKIASTRRIKGGPYMKKAGRDFQIDQSHFLTLIVKEMSDRWLAECPSCCSHGRVQVVYFNAV